ncbi:hypothetical protein HK405_008688 [Cladochytrium tenue]|nr:hypothetical protein HK405_008688 [Cladochytrium tenue]
MPEADPSLTTTSTAEAAAPSRPRVGSGGSRGLLSAFEIPADEQEGGASHSRWVNRDIQPIEEARRTWRFVTFNNYWLLVNTNISTYLTGSSLIALGLSWWQTLICIIVGNLLATFFVLLNSLPGAYYHIGFPVVNRMVWGMWGSQFAIWNRIFLSLVWYGFTAWVGGECVYVMLLSWDPALEDHIPNTIPEDTGMTTAQFVAYIVFNVVSLPVIWIRPHKLERFFYVAASITMVFFVVLLVWALATMGSDGFGSTITASSELPVSGGPSSLSWVMVYGIVSMIGSIAAGILNQNDYARFATEPRHAIWGQAFSFPLFGIVCGAMGMLVTAALQQRFGGDALWNPPDVFSRLITDSGGADPGTRAAAFFAGLCLVVSQIGVNVPGNALSGGFDLAATFPRYINIRRGAFLTAVLSVVVNPWRLVNTATTFLTVLSSYSVFLGPMTGLMVANYLVICRRKINVDDLYQGVESIYWFDSGVNWRAFVAWAVGTAPTLPGFIGAVNTSVVMPDGATELYYISYLYGFFASGLTFVLLHRLFPVRNLDSFVSSKETPEELMRFYADKWELYSAENGDFPADEQIPKSEEA